jgi:hypothetical protein
VERGETEHDVHIGNQAAAFACYVSFFITIDLIPATVNRSLRKEKSKRQIYMFYHQQFIQD